MTKKVFISFSFVIIILLATVISCREDSETTGVPKKEIIELKYWCASNSHEISLARLLVKE